MSTEMLSVPATEMPTTTPEATTTLEILPPLPRRRGSWRIEYWLIILPMVAAALWSFSFRNADPRTMGGLGLLSLFTPVTVVALALLSVSMLLCLHWNVPERLLSLNMVTYLVLIHGTPAVLYGTVRYPWSYKHIGIVDYILRNHSVDPSIPVGTVYHNWPGFFAGSALLTEAAGRPNAMGIALWSPLAFNLLNLLVLRYVFRGLTRNTRLVWLSLWIFFIIMWVGQDYFAPQAMAFALYLVCIGLLIRRKITRPMLAAFVAVVSVVAASHQITPMMLFIAVAALVVLRRTPGWYLPIIVAGATAAWGLLAAPGYTIPGLRDIISELGKPVTNASETLDKAIVANESQLLVVWGGRVVVLLATALALIGAWRSWRARGLGMTAALLMALPGALVLITGFGGEVLFRAFLFAAPFIAFLAAAACLPKDGRGFPVKNLVFTALVTAVLLPGFLLDYYGKEQQNYFTPAELRAVDWVDTHARPGSLLVEGSRNYPNQFHNYERFTYVAIDWEPPESYLPLLDDPVGGLEDWLSDPRYSDAYVLITRTQKIAAENEHSLPTGALSRVETALRSSPKFRVAYDSGDGVVFVLSEPEGDR